MTVKKLDSVYYIGNTPRAVAKQTRSQRFFYGMRSDGEELVLCKVDAFDSNDGVLVNEIGDNPLDDFPYFIPGIDFFEGNDENHAERYPSLIYQQYKWDDGNYSYYVDDNGELTLRVNQGIDEGDVLVPNVPINPIQKDYRRFGVFPTFDNNTVTFDNNDINFDNKEPTE